MNKQTLHRSIIVAALSSIAFLSATAYAGPDFNQLEMNRRVTQAKQKLQQAEAAKGEERQKLMGEHMKMMKETMEKMQAMKPKSGMTMEEHEEWITEHQKLMEDVMGQMMEEHHMMMGKDCMSMGSGEDHKH